MKWDIFYLSGKIIYKCRWLIIIFWFLLLIVSIPFTPSLMQPFKIIGFLDPHSESAKANEILNKKIGYGYNRFIVIYQSHQLKTTDPEFFNEVKKSLSNLKKLSSEHQIIYPDENKKQVSKDKHSAYAIVLFKSGHEVESKLLKEIKANLHKPAKLTMRIGGDPIFLEDTKTQTQTDLYRAEYIATPVAIITMLIVFGSVVAASIPIILGGISAYGILMILFCIGNLFSLSVFTLNIALLLGLCLTIDYSLFVISRFRDELGNQPSVAEAIAITQATASKAVFFSGLAVFASLSALLLFPVNILYSVGIGGLTAVGVSVIIAIVLLPAILSILNKRINFLSIRVFHKRKTRDGAWKWIATRVVGRPFTYFFTILILLLFFAYPFTGVKLGISDFRILPKNTNSRQVLEIFNKKFSGEGGLTPILILAESSESKFLHKANIAHLYNFTKKLKDDPRVNQVSSLVTTEPHLTKEQYQTLYTMPKDQLTPEIKKLLKLTTHKDITVITVTSKYPDVSPQTRELIKTIRDSDPGGDITLQVTGNSVNTLDVLQQISHIFPYAFLWIVSFTYLILLILLRSIFLPFKAILMTILSLSASYGVLVFVIQDGYFHQLLNFEPQGMVDISLLIIIFCALFGISMDYEVFLLTRIKEYYEKTHDNTKSIVYGIDHSSKIITSAAIIVILICFAFMSAGVLIVKAFGLGIAVAAFVDAFLIRTLLVPSTMTLVKDWNWYCPKWLLYILPKVTFDTSSKEIKKSSKKTV